MGPNRPSAANLAATQAKYTARNPLIRIANQRFFKALAAMLRRLPADSVLDAGCGEGVLLNRVSASRLVGIDLDRRRAQLARVANPGAAIAVADVVRMPFAPDSFELVLLLEVLEHVGDPIAALSEAARVSRRYLLASVPNEPWWRIGNMVRLKYLRQLGNTPEHIQHWSARGFRSFISKAFLILDIRKPFLWTFVLGEKTR